MKFMVYVLLAAVLGLSVVVGYQFSAISSARSGGREETCHAFEAQYNAFAKITRDGEKSAAKLAYYKEHPDELATAIANSEKNLALLKASSIPSYC